MRGVFEGRYSSRQLKHVLKRSVPFRLFEAKKKTKRISGGCLEYSSELLLEFFCYAASSVAVVIVVVVVVGVETHLVYIYILYRTADSISPSALDY